MKKIKLLNSHLMATVDDRDFKKASSFNWSITSDGYVYTGHHEQKTFLFLHRLIKPSKNGLVVDHKNRDKLDNTRKNLRHATKSQNAGNAKMWSNNTSGFRGVFWCKNISKWMAAIRSNGKFKTLGFFKDKRDAARAYNEAAQEIFGEFAYLNKIE